MTTTASTKQQLDSPPTDNTQYQQRSTIGNRSRNEASAMKLIPMAGGEEYRGVSQSGDASQRLSTGLFCSIGTSGEGLNQVLLGGFDSIHSIEGNDGDPSKLRLDHRPPPDNVPVFTLVHPRSLATPTSRLSVGESPTFDTANAPLPPNFSWTFGPSSRLQFTNMVAVHKETMDSKKTVSLASDENLKKEDEFENLNYPPPWPFEKWFLGGYSQSRTIGFKSPKMMYKAINLFAGKSYPLVDSVAIMYYGYDQGVRSQVNLNPHYQELMGIAPIEVTLIGALFAGSLADRMGRIKAVVFGSMWALFSKNLPTTTLPGCAALVRSPAPASEPSTVFIPVRPAEVSSHSARGAFLAIEFFMNIGGLALAYWIEYFAYLGPNHEMVRRTPLALQIAFIFIIGIGINFFPESPRWLMKMGREQEARNMLQATRENDVEYELKGIKKVVKYKLETSGAIHYAAMLFPKDKYSIQLRWRVFLAELVGIGVITVYAIDLFQDAGFGLTTSKLLAGFNNISYMFSVIFAVITLDRYATMVWGAIAMAVELLIAGILDKYAQVDGPQKRSFGAGFATLTSLYTATFGATWLTTPWLYPTDIFPLNVRAKGGAWSVVGWSIGNGIITMITPFLFQAILYSTLLLLFGLNIFCIPFVILLYPETAGRSLEQMDTFFEHGGSWNVYKASHAIRDKGIEDWRWMKKLKAEDHEELEKGRRMSSAVRLPEEDEKDARKSWRKRPVFTFRRKGSNAGIMPRKFCVDFRGWGGYFDGMGEAL
ncbi:MAG: hypothetical protein Q9210_007010 [Variospora velana]